MKEFEDTYKAPDREEVLAGLKKYGTEDRTQWVDAPAPRQFNEDEFARAWGSSGGRTVSDLQNFIKQGGYDQLGVTTGGSKGDKVYRNGQFLADAVLAAGEGGRGAHWLKDTGGGGAPAPAPTHRLYTPGGPALGSGAAGDDSTLMKLLGAVPTESDFFQNLLAQAQQQAGLTGMDRNAILALMQQG